MTNKVGQSNISPIDLSKLSEQNNKLNTNNNSDSTGNLAGLSVKTIEPTDDKPLQLTFNSKQKGKGVSDPFSDDPNVKPGHDPNGPGNSENAPGHNKEVELPPPPPPEPIRQETEHRYQLQQEIKQELKTNDLFFRRETEKRQTINQRIEQGQNNINLTR